MLFGEHLVVVRGGGDLASGVVYQLHRAGFPVVVLELDRPLVIRRTVAFASAVLGGRAVVEGIESLLVDTPDRAIDLAGTGVVPVMVSPDLPSFDGQPPSVVVDARLAKRNIDTTIDDALLVVGLGPGFTAGVDCHAVVETMRGHRLGRPIWAGAAEPDTGVPGRIGGASIERVVRAPAGGEVEWSVSIGDVVGEGELLGTAGGKPVRAPIDGVVRGLIASGFVATTGLKIGDVDPRADRAACFEISDKARLVGSGVLDAVLSWLNGREE